MSIDSENKIKFVDEYKKSGSIKDACEAIGKNRQWYYRIARKDEWVQSQLRRNVYEGIKQQQQRFAATDMLEFTATPKDERIRLQKQFLELWPRNNWNVSKTLKQINVSPAAYYKTWKKEEAFLDALKALQEEFLDFFIGNLCEISADDKRGMPSVTATIYALKCMGKDHGWDEKGNQINVNVQNYGVMAVPVKVSSEEWEKIATEQQSNLIENVEQRKDDNDVVDVEVLDG